MLNDYMEKVMFWKWDKWSTLLMNQGYPKPCKLLENLILDNDAFGMEMVPFGHLVDLVLFDDITWKKWLCENIWFTRTICAIIVSHSVNVTSFRLMQMDP